MSLKLRVMGYRLRVAGCGLRVASCFVLFFLFSFFSFGQVSSSVDTTRIKIGEQITYNIQVETDSTDLVVFPDGPFLPLEMLDSYPVDTTKNGAKLTLEKQYGLTKFDSGAFYIPRQRVVVAGKPFFTDSVQVEVQDVKVDTTKQGLYDIKPLMEVDKPKSNFLKTLLWTVLILALVLGLLYWFLWREKPLTEEEKIALLPPYDRAKISLKKLDDNGYLEKAQIKEFYSELTFAIRNYLDEKVYDRALESTTDELISHLKLLKEGHQFELSSDTIRNLESILKRADLVKFAKSNPDIELAKMDRDTIDKAIDSVKTTLPEPDEEEKLLDEQYRLEQERKQKRRKIIWSVGAVVGVLALVFIAFGIKNGFSETKDNVLQHRGQKLLNNTWVTSDYGVPPITLSTPEVLVRKADSLSENGRVKTTAFNFKKADVFSIFVETSSVKNPKDSLNLKNEMEGGFKLLEKRGYKNIITQAEKFTTPNGAEGVKTHGTLNIPVGSEQYIKGKYTMLNFAGDNKVLQQVLFVWRDGDVYADKIANRIEASVELQPKTEEQ